MKLANLDDRAVLVDGGTALDVADASAGRFPAHLPALYGEWEAFREWAPSAPWAGAAAVGDRAFGPPSPTPAQVFGLALNYHDHAAETGRPAPAMPGTFTKFPTCLAGDDATVSLPSEHVDWEVELVVVIGARAFKVAEGDAWSHVAGVTVGQDLSERVVQYAAANQFCLGKSYPGFGPMGPWLVTPDELAHPDDLAIGCTVNGEQVQDSRTSDMVFGVGPIIARLSEIVPLLPGDVIFTGTPSGVGATRQPPRFLAPGDEIVSTIEGIGTLRTRCR